MKPFGRWEIRNFSIQIHAKYTAFRMLRILQASLQI